MDKQAYVGWYTTMGFELEVRLDGAELVGAIPGVPEGYEIGLEGVGEQRFRLRGGPVDGSTAEFILGEDGAVTAMHIGFIELARASAPPPLTITYLTAPPAALTPEKEAAFQRLLAAILANPTGGEIDYDLPYPKHEFVQYVMAQDVLIFHGSNNRAIDVFQPVRTSVELSDKSGAGNLQAVYGTHDGLWSMFFAIVHRQQLKGSIRNGVMYVHNRAGEALAVYHFSINQEQLAEQPWTAGALYLLPRAAFARQPVTEESFSNEWACPTPVKPLARLDLEPEDFPFLHQIGGHDDGFLIRAEILGKRMHAAALSASLEGARFSVSLPNSVETAQDLADWVKIQEELIPTAQFQVEQAPDRLTLVIEALPPAHQQVFGKEYEKLIGDRG